MKNKIFCFVWILLMLLFFNCDTTITDVGDSSVQGLVNPPDVSYYTDDGSNGNDTGPIFFDTGWNEDVSSDTKMDVSEDVLEDIFTDVASDTSLIPPCNQHGGVRGRICGLSEGYPGWVGTATVFVDALNCEGTTTHVETTTDELGNFTLQGIPVGDQVVNIQKGLFQTTRSVTIENGEITDISQNDAKTCTGSLGKIAVTQGVDKVEDLLTELGFTYTMFNVTDLLPDLTTMRQFNAIFINCSNYTNLTNLSNNATAKQNLQTFVNEGGSLYLSDFAYILTKTTFPDMMTYETPDARIGDIQTIPGVVEDLNLIDYLGGVTAVEIVFSRNIWAMVKSVNSGTQVIVSGSPMDMSDHLHADIPLMVYREVGAGKIVFTSFHNDEQMQESAEMLNLIKYLIWTMIIPAFVL